MWSLQSIKEAVGIKLPPGYETGRQEIPGVVAAEYAANDAIGTQFMVQAPKGSILSCATYYDLSDLNVQVNVVVSRQPFRTLILDNAQFDVANVDELLIDYELQFTVFTNHLTSRSSYLDNIGRDLKFPKGQCWLQAWSPATQTIVASRLPQIELKFRPDN